MSGMFGILGKLTNTRDMNPFFGKEYDLVLSQYGIYKLNMWFGTCAIFAAHDRNTKKRIAIRDEITSFENNQTKLSKSFQICLSESRIPLNPLVNHNVQYEHAINREYNPSFSDSQK